MNLKTSLQAALLAFCFASVSVMAATLNVFTADKPNIMVAQTNPNFTLKLKSNPTTGFTWFLRDYDDALVVPVKHTFETSETKLMGAPGYDFWEFKMKPSAFLVPRQTIVRMIYARPFSGDNVTPVMFTISTMPTQKNIKGQS